MLQIRLDNVRFYCYHGIDVGEEILGGEYVVDLVVTYRPREIPVVSLSNTIDYTNIYGLVKERMSRPTGLLETLATEIASEIIAKFSLAEEVEISISKLHPPIRSFEGSVGVTFKMKRE